MILSFVVAALGPFPLRAEGIPRPIAKAPVHQLNLPGTVTELAGVAPTA
jgi:hypothetical protein